MNRLALEVVAEAEIAQHFKKRMVTRRVPHILKVIVFTARSDALLRRHRPLIRPLLQPQKRLLKLIHARIGKQQRGVIRWHQ